MGEESRKFTSKQMGDACEMLVAAELTLAGIPAMRVPEQWPGYDVVAQPFDRGVQRISVKSRTFKRGPAFIRYGIQDNFDWLAVVLLPSQSDTRRQIFIIPRKIADRQARRNAPHTKSADGRYWKVDEIEKRFARFRNNFALTSAGTSGNKKQRTPAYQISLQAIPSEDGGGFVATVPDLPGCMSDGATPEEALTNVQDAILTWIEAAQDLGHAVPKPSRRLALTG